MVIEYKGFFDRETMMKQWDSWRAYIADEGGGSWPRDAFEALLDYFEERLQQGVQADAKRCQQISDVCKYREHSKHCIDCNHYGTA